MKRVYLCGSITGQSYKSIIEWHHKIKEKLESFDFECVSPMRNKHLIAAEEKIIGSYENLNGYSSHDIFARDKFDVSQSDIILVNFLSNTINMSIGSLFEIAWGYLLGKYIVVVTSKDSIYNHLFIREAASIMFEDLEEAIDYLVATFGK